MCHSRFRGPIWAASLALASHDIACTEAHAQAVLPPMVVEPPRAPTVQRRSEPSTRPVAVRRVAAGRARQNAAPRATATPPRQPAPAAPVPDRRGYTAAPAGLNLATPNTSGSRLGLTPAQIPASIEIIPGQKIRDRGQETVAEAVTQNATGITNVGAPGNGGAAYTSRGFTGVNSVQNLYDGTRLVPAVGTVTFPYDTWSADRIEVLRGPASVLYGDGAIGGIINVVPKKPTFVAVNEARVAYGSDGTKRVAADSGGPIGDEVAYRLNVSANAAGGWLRQNGDFRNVATSSAILWKPSADLSFTLSHDYGYQEPLAYFGTPLVDGRIPRDLRFTNFNVDDNRIRFTDNFTQLKSEWSPTADITFRNTSYYLSIERRYRDVENYTYLPSTRQIGRDDYIEIYHDQDQIGNRFDATFRNQVFGMGNIFLAGFDVNHLDFKRTSNTPFAGSDVVGRFLFNPGTFLRATPTRADFRTSTDQASFFAEDRLAITDQLALVAGIRYDSPHVKRDDLLAPARSFAKTYDTTSYRVGAVYNPLPSTSLYVQYATAADPVGTLITTSFAQRNFKLSTGEQIEGGIKQTLFDGRAEFTLAGYRIQKRDLLTANPLTPTVTVQVGSQSSEGFEAAGSVAILDNLRLEGNIAILRAQYDRFTQAEDGVAVSYRGNQPIDVPNRVSNLWLSWAFAPRWEARIGWQHVGSVFSDFTNTSKRPAYDLLNATIDYRVTDNSRLSLRAYNLTDEVYAVTGSVNQWLLGRPRSFEAAYTVAF